MKLQQKIAENRCTTTTLGAKTKQETTKENNLGRIGKDGETCPCRNNTVKNGEESSAKPGFFLQISTFPAVFNLAFLA